MATRTNSGLSPYVRIERYIPQSLPFPRCDLVISHGGSTRCSRHWPMASLRSLSSITGDQPHNAERCRAAGAARIVPLAEATAASIRCTGKQPTTGADDPRASECIAGNAWPNRSLPSSWLYPCITQPFSTVSWAWTRCAAPGVLVGISAQVGSIRAAEVLPKVLSNLGPANHLASCGPLALALRSSHMDPGSDLRHFFD